mmetsp:Transcript_32080/g.54829  ORF Transcript_32080/g.54829 Transcript_32080/m.54829 type:complete len:255 (-) Transcript_32080:62-826(-)
MHDRNVVQVPARRFLCKQRLVLKRAKQTVPAGVSQREDSVGDTIDGRVHNTSVGFCGENRCHLLYKRSASKQTVGAESRPKRCPPPTSTLSEATRHNCRLDNLHPRNSHPLLHLVKVEQTLHGQNVSVSKPEEVVRRDQEWKQSHLPKQCLEPRTHARDVQVSRNVWTFRWQNVESRGAPSKPTELVGVCSGRKMCRLLIRRVQRVVKVQHNVKVLGCVVRQDLLHDRMLFAVSTSDTRRHQPMRRSWKARKVR